MILSALLIAIKTWWDLPLFGITFAGFLVATGIIVDMIIEYLLIRSLIKYLRTK